MRHLEWFAVAITLVGLAACERSQQEEAAAPETAQTASDPAAAVAADSAAIDAAIASADRLAGDSEQDTWRKPAEVLEALELRAGMQAIDYLAAGGYYTELMSRVVGPQGRVIAYNNEQYLKYSGDKPAQRYRDDRLANVEQVTTAPEDLQLQPDSLDAALFMQTYHDLYWRPKDNSWVTDPAKSLERLVPALKSGAVVVVVDHVAAPGSDPTGTADSLHRIDPAIVKRDFEAAGLAFESESPVFRNTADDHTKEVFDPAIRRKTDQVMYKFRKR